MPESAETTKASLLIERHASGVLLIQIAGDWLKDADRRDSAAALSGTIADFAALVASILAEVDQ